MVGVIVFGNQSGIAIQARRLAYMLKPNRILYVDARPFAKNKAHHPEWYSQFTGYITKGFPTNREIDAFTKGLTTVYAIENPLNFYLLDACQRQGIKLYIQSNYEFCDHLNRDLTLPTKFIMPSYWMIDEMKKKFGDERVMYLPPPINPAEFTKAREQNFSRKGKRFLHIVGTLAVHDRNGTLSLLDALQHTKQDFELVIRSQGELPSEYIRNDHRIKYDFKDIENESDMYYDFDALILPRRYGGLSLVCNEALMSGLPVIMPDISPNSQLLPKKWLISAHKVHSFMTRVLIDVYEVDPLRLAQKIDEFATRDLTTDKIEAFELAYDTFSESVLLPEYQKL